MDKVEAARADFARNFDYVIVDTSPLTKSNLAVLFATVANGTMLALRYGRLGTSVDDETMRMLTRVGANVLGALTINSKVIKAFRERAASPTQSLVLAPRQVTPRHSSAPELGREITETSSRSKIVS
jgi:cellulose biosynthesis protein BcsQ